MKNVINFTLVKVRQSQDCLNKAVKIFQEPTERRKRTPNLGGFCRLRLSASLEPLSFQIVASPKQGQKTRIISPTRLADNVGKQIHVSLLNRSQGLTCNPVNEPQLYYTDTSLTPMVSNSQLSLGGRGLTYFSPTLLPTVAFSSNCNFN